MPIRIDTNESAMRVLHQVRSNLRELTYNLYSMSGETSPLRQDGTFAEVLAGAVEPQEAEPSAWDKGYTVDRGVSYTASRVIDEQLHAMTKVKVAALRASDGFYAERRERWEPPDIGPRDDTGAAQSVIRDADMAKTMTRSVSDHILSQSVQSLLAQANQDSGMVLSLLA